MRLALFQPDIAPNAGAIMRLAACMGVSVDLIEPAGFVLDDRRLRRALMDYGDHLDLVRHADWSAFRPPARLVLLTTAGDVAYTDFRFRTDDTLVLGRESAGVPDHVHRAAEARVRVPMSAHARSLNVAVAGAMVLGEALRQTGLFPELPS